MYDRFIHNEKYDCECGFWNPFVSSFINRMIFFSSFSSSREPNRDSFVSLLCSMIFRSFFFRFILFWMQTFEELVKRVSLTDNNRNHIFIGWLPNARFPRVHRNRNHRICRDREVSVAQRDKWSATVGSSLGWYLFNHINLMEIFIVIRLSKLFILIWMLWWAN